jgi:hypothetical protein
MTKEQEDMEQLKKEVSTLKLLVKALQDCWAQQCIDSALP